MGQQVNVIDELKLYPGARVSGMWNGAFDRGGRTYYVNNITGLASNDGLSWDTAMSEVTTAITASETHRKLGGGYPDTLSVATNDYVRNTIVIQGTGTTYGYIATMPSYVDVIGLGAPPFGDGSGIVVIGDPTGSYDGMAGSTRGSHWYNLQFVAATGDRAVDLVLAYRSLFDTCAFGSNSVTVAACAIAFNCDSSSGLVLRDCKTIGHSDIPIIGYRFSEAGGNFNENLIERCYANASTTGFTNKGVLSQGTVVRDCIFYGGTTGLTDTANNAQTRHSAFYFHNFATGATTGMTKNSYPEQHCMLNYSVSNATSAVYFAIG